MSPAAHKTLTSCNDRKRVTKCKCLVCSDISRCDRPLFLQPSNNKLSWWIMAWTSSLCQPIGMVTFRRMEHLLFTPVIYKITWTIFGYHRIGYGAPLRWSPRSPDISLWLLTVGSGETLVYLTKPWDINDLKGVSSPSYNTTTHQSQVPCSKDAWLAHGNILDIFISG
jgi:hypothetical protein